MGRHVDAHIARYVEGRMDFLEFRDCFLGEALADAVDQRMTQRNIEAFARARAGEAFSHAVAGLKTPLPTEHAPITPEELLAALAPPRPAEPARHEPLTFYAAWNALADGMFTLWCNFAERVQRFWWLALAFVVVIILIDGFILHW